VNINQTTNSDRISGSIAIKDPLLSSSESPDVHTQNHVQYKSYKFRYINLTLFCFASMINQICWISMTPIADAVSNAYSVTKTTVNTISLVYMGIYIFANFPSVYILGTYGLRVGVIFFIPYSSF
jgi:fucose permease